jgi:hypothetical protein
LKFHLARHRHAITAEPRLVDEDELRAILRVLPDLHAPALHDVVLPLVVDLVGIAERDEHTPAIAEPPRARVFTKALIRLLDADEIVTECFVLRRRRIRIGRSQEREPHMSAVGERC